MKRFALLALCPLLMMAAGALSMIIPLVALFLAQRIFMSGVVITGVEK